MSFSSVLNEFLATSAIARAARSQIRKEITPSEPRLDLLRDNRPIPPRPSSDLGYKVAKSCGQIQLAQFIATAVFLLSNRLHDSRDGDQGLELLCTLLDRDASLTTILLRNYVPSIRATWESLFEFAMWKHRRKTFRVLANIGMYNHWFDSSKPGYCLTRAIDMDCYDIVHKIVAYCCDSNHSKWWRDSGTAIMGACKKGNVEYARLLIQHCSVNSRGIGYKKWSMFQVLIKEMESSSNEHALALELFLANGADVDKKTSMTMITEKWEEMVGQDKLFDATRPTILDEVFYLNRTLFDKLQPYSRVPVSKVTRIGLLVALENGSQTLRDYLSARQSASPSFNWRYVQSLLELLLAEQFTMSKTVDMRVVQGLCEFGVDFTMPSVEVDIQDFWTTEPVNPKYHDLSWYQFTNVNDRIRLLGMLLTKGGAIGELVLEEVVAQYGTNGLECLATRLTDFPTKAVRALIRAARMNKFEDVEFLLRKGVDLNATIVADGRTYSIQAAAIQAFFSRNPYVLSSSKCSLEMTQLLTRHGARLIVSPDDSTPFEFANHLLSISKSSDLMAKIRYVLGATAGETASFRLPSFLLESCIRGGNKWKTYPEVDNMEKRIEIFEYLFRQGAELSPGSPLAALIYEGGPEELVRDVLYSGSDLNEYYYDNCPGFCQYTPLQIAVDARKESLVRLLLDEGANVNSPARGHHGHTALQAACYKQPATEEEHQCKMRICRLLIDQGADINASPSSGGGTPLTLAAGAGDLELAMLLLREGADVNARGNICNVLGGQALDWAASCGRLDMVKFLLNANAISATRGNTGYDGAISKAACSSHLAVADLIREHAAKVQAGTVFNPELLKAQDECHVSGFGNDLESSDDN